MDQTGKLLNTIAQTAQMGQSSVDNLLNKTGDPTFRDALLQQREQYQTFRQDAETRLNALGIRPEPKRLIDRAGARVGLEMSTLQDHSNAHFADLMIQGITMGVIEATKARNECPDASADAQGVASNFIAVQQDAIESMKGFLR